MRGEVQEIYNNSHWSRFEHEGAINTSQLADKYLIKHPEIQQYLEDQEDEYSVLPYKTKNYGDALKLLEEEMANEYQDGQPFIDPGSQAYQMFDYDGQENDSNEANDNQESKQQQLLSQSHQQAIGKGRRQNKKSPEFGTLSQLENLA